MKIAIHKRINSFSDRWIDYCENNNISFKIVNCYDSNIIEQLDDCDGLMWHWDQNDYKARLFALQLTFALEKTQIKVFPDLNTSFHFDDKVGQKYLLESVGMPIISSHVFYSKEDALKWINNSAFPKVFKLRGGAGSVNVRLAKTRSEAKKLTNKAFNKGFSSINKLTRLKDRFSEFKNKPSLLSFRGLFSGFIRLFIPLELERFSSRDKGYIYFQDFIEKNEYDTRLVVVGERCFGIRRYCRKGDFRASGSGIVAYDQNFFDHEMIKIAFKTAKELKTQSLAFDFIWDNNQPKIIEISYCYSMGSVYDNCNGYWDENLKWYDKKVNPQYFIMEDFTGEIKNNKYVN
jgi:glutathione synthase/RimK-type ligase-like ATP-grasp enzyme